MLSWLKAVLKYTQRHEHGQCSIHAVSKLKFNTIFKEPHGLLMMMAAVPQVYNGSCSNVVITHEVIKPLYDPLGYPFHLFYSKFHNFSIIESPMGNYAFWHCKNVRLNPLEASKLYLKQKNPLKAKPSSPVEIGGVLETDVQKLTDGELITDHTHLLVTYEHSK